MAAVRGSEPFWLLLYNDRSRKWSVTPEGRDILALHRAKNKKTRVVSIVGPMRSGKSYLLTRFAGQQRGFSLGDTTASHTRGIWAWFPASLQAGDDSVMLMDTEGMHSNDRDPEFDAQVFSFSLLLSAAVLYNALGALNNDTIDKLAAAAHACRALLPVTTADAGAGWQPPALFLVSRDVHLPPHPRFEGSHEAYLADMLASEPVTDGPSAVQVMLRNATRELLRRTFPVLEYHVCIRPTSDDAALLEVDKQPETALRPEFLAGCARIVQSAMRIVRGTSHGAAFSGRMLLHAIEQLCVAINSGHAVSADSVLLHASLAATFKPVLAALAHARTCAAWLQPMLPVPAARMKALTRGCIEDCGDAAWTACATGSERDALDLVDSWDNLQRQLHMWAAGLHAANSAVALARCDAELSAGVQRARGVRDADAFPSMAAFDAEVDIVSLRERIAVWSDAAAFGDACHEIARGCSNLLDLISGTARMNLASRTAAAAAGVLAADRAAAEAAEAQRAAERATALQREEADRVLLATSIAQAAQALTSAAQHAASETAACKSRLESAAATERAALAAARAAAQNQQAAATAAHAAAMQAQLDQQRAAYAAELAKLR